MPQNRRHLSCLIARYSANKEEGGRRCQRQDFQSRRQVPFQSLRQEPLV